MRYNKVKKFFNDDDYYTYLTKNRDLKSVTHYETPILRNPTISDRLEIVTDSHIWSYGNRLSNLSYQYYGDVRYWWVIAWYNGVAIEGDLKNGDLIEIPVDLRKALQILGV
ncbi:MAG: hypothetical protein CMF52_03260 [Legionellales bacterium]|nr:hypothetical protein [Legionellales bacterium]|tara:strand:- start:950 stop:1282 length:333 start_codon:yes stop_codon:yes gene_type:complete